MTPDASRKLTVPEVARRYRVAPETVLAWVKSGQLAAINVARPGSRRPRFRVDQTDLVAFDARRAVVPIVKPTGRRRQDPSIIEFF